MKKKVIILRFGSVIPLKKEFAIMSTLTEGSGECVGCSTNIGVISIVNTQFTPKQITELFRNVAEETEDTLPVIAWYDDGDAGFDLTSELFENFKECNDTFDREFGKDLNGCSMTLDELLDLVNTKGLPQFTEEELKRLKELSK
jgi:hypothetical protein